MTPRATSLDFERTARVFHALAEPTRLRLVDLLRGVCELTEALETGQSRLSFHLKALKDAGIVQDRREGRWVYYSLNQERVEEVAAVLTDCCTPSKPWLKAGCCS